MKQIKRPANMGNMESLIASKNIDDSRWFPISIPHYRQELTCGAFFTIDYTGRSNIAYNLQYLQYIELQLGELNVTSSIRKLLYKNFIVVAVSILELVFLHLVKQENKLKHKEYKLINQQDISCPPNFSPPAGTNKFTLQCFEKLSVPEEPQITFSSLVQIVRDNKLLNDADLNINAGYISYLRKNLRNKIHLTIAKDVSETDYNTYSYNDFISAKVFLFMVLTDSKFDKTSQKIFPRILDCAINQISSYNQNNCSQIYKWIN